MRRDLTELLVSYKLLTDSGAKKQWREWAFSNTEFDGEWEYQEFHEALDQIDQGLKEGVA